MVSLSTSKSSRQQHPGRRAARSDCIAITAAAAASAPAGGMRIWRGVVKSELRREIRPKPGSESRDASCSPQADQQCRRFARRRRSQQRFRRWIGSVGDRAGAAIHSVLVLCGHRRGGLGHSGWWGRHNHAGPCSRDILGVAAVLVLVLLFVFWTLPYGVALNSGKAEAFLWRWWRQFQRELSISTGALARFVTGRLSQSFNTYTKFQPHPPSHPPLFTHTRTQLYSPLPQIMIWTS